jgi:ABC-type transport system involved in multi-copper enzyme maturation permease subunit
MHSIWAVAQNTLAQALRMRIAVVIILLLLILLPIMGKIMDGDGTLLGKLQTFTSYSLGLISFLLCILTIAISAFTLSNDLKRKHIYMVVTKPIRRTELIAGKLLGILMLNGGLLFIFGLIVYGLTLLIGAFSEAPSEQRLRAQAEFFTSRVGVKTVLNKEELNKRAMDRFNELKGQGQIPEGMTIRRPFASFTGRRS